MKGLEERKTSHPLTRRRHGRRSRSIMNRCRNCICGNCSLKIQTAVSA